MITTSVRTALRARGLRKSYGTAVVLDGIDLEIAEGTVFALLGPNGAGKTTTVQILSTLISADSGDAEIAGFDLRKNPGAVRSAIGVTGQFSAVDNLLTGEENLLLMADLHHLGRRAARGLAAELLDRFDLSDASGKLVSTYSGGMRRRLDLAMTLIGDPRIIFLDEPTTGLDPRSRRTMWQIIRELAGDGITIFLTTQYLDEADELADRIAVLDHGQIVAEGTPGELKRRIPGSHAELHVTDHDAAKAIAAALAGSTLDDEALKVKVPADDTPKSLADLLDRLGPLAAQVAHICIHTPDLDDVFFALTGNPLTANPHPEQDN